MAKMTVREMELICDIIEKQIREENKNIDVKKIEKEVIDRLKLFHKELWDDLNNAVAQRNLATEKITEVNEKLKKLNQSTYRMDHSISTFEVAFGPVIHEELKVEALKAGMIPVDRKQMMMDIVLHQNKDASEIVKMIVNGLKKRK